MQKRYKNTANGEGKHFTATYTASKAMEKQSCGGHKLITQAPVQELTHPLSLQTNACLKKGASIEIFSCLTVGKPGAVNRAKIHLSIVPTMAHCYQCFPVLQSGNTG